MTEPVWTDESCLRALGVKENSCPFREDIKPEDMPEVIADLKCLRRMLHKAKCEFQFRGEGRMAVLCEAICDVTSILIAHCNDREAHLWREKA